VARPSVRGKQRVPHGNQGVESESLRRERREVGYPGAEGADRPSRCSIAGARWHVRLSRWSTAKLPAGNWITRLSVKSSQWRHIRFPIGEPVLPVRRMWTGCIPGT